MATLTAQILVGYPHANHGGINPTHYIFLSENSSPSWVLFHQNVMVENESDIEKITWIPTVENMLEDALLMTAIHVCKNCEILELAKKFCSKIESDWIELYPNFNESQLSELYQKCSEIIDFPKLIIAVFKGSTIENQLSLLEKYKMEVEVCSPMYSRTFSSWRNETKIEGSLR